MTRAPTIRIRGNTEAGKKAVAQVNFYKEGAQLAGLDTSAIDAAFVAEYRAKLEAGLGANKAVILGAVASKKEMEAKALAEEAAQIRAEIPTGKKA